MPERTQAAAPMAHLQMCKLSAADAASSSRLRPGRPGLTVSERLRFRRGGRSGDVGTCNGVMCVQWTAANHASSPLHKSTKQARPTVKKQAHPTTEQRPQNANGSALALACSRARLHSCHVGVCA